MKKFKKIKNAKKKQDLYLKEEIGSNLIKISYLFVQTWIKKLFLKNKIVKILEVIPLAYKKMKKNKK